MSITSTLLTAQRFCPGCNMPLRTGEVCLNRECLTNRVIRRRIVLQRQLEHDHIDLSHAEFACWLHDTGKIGETA